jgi:hypothetical protein
LYVSDDSGYQVQDSDLIFLSILPAAMVAMINQQVPLGMNEKEFNQFCETLAEAAQRDGIKDVDIRLQGSAAKFFSGAHKEMAYNRKAIVEDFETGSRTFPQGAGAGPNMPTPSESLARPE